MSTTLCDFSFPKQRQLLRIATDLHQYSWHSHDFSAGSVSPTYQSLTTPSAATPSPGTVDDPLIVSCIYDFQSADPDHLSFSKGEVLFVIKKEESGWWAAMRPHGDRIGWIPSSFVQPLTSNQEDNLRTPQDNNRLVEYSNEITWVRKGRPEIDDSPQSAIHEFWVRASEDHKAMSLQVVTPTDLIPLNDFLDSAYREQTHTSFVDFSDRDELSSSPVEKFHFPPPTSFNVVSPISSPSSPVPATITHPKFLRRHHTRPRGVLVNDQASLLRLSELLQTHPALPDPIVESYVEPPESSQLGSVPQACGYRRKTDVQVEAQGLPPSPGDHSNNDALSRKISSNLTIWSPDNIAQYFCVLMHSLYARIRQDECFEWMKQRKIPEHSGLRRFLSAHDHITVWVQESFRMHDVSDRAEALAFWVRVAECLHLRNHDSLGAIILALTPDPEASFGTTWPDGTLKQTFNTLFETVDISNGFDGLINVMNAVPGPSVPFVCAYLGYVKSFDVGRPDRHYSDPASGARWRGMTEDVKNLLRHQPVQYKIEVIRSVQRFVDDHLGFGSAVD